MIYFNENTYLTKERKIGFFSKLFPTFFLTTKSFFVILKGSRKAKRGKYDDIDWVKSSYEFVEIMESLGGKLCIEGLENLKKFNEPAVFVGNHMSTLETVILPCIINPLKRVTFIVKRQLVEVAIFKWIMRARNPVVVGRTNPKEDLLTVMNEGADRLKKGFSIIVFPQTTRTVNFDSKKFNSIAIKLAKKAGVPIIPFALKTDAWANGKIIKEMGKFDRTKTVHILFGEPIIVAERGNEQHQQIIEFIQKKLSEWS